MIRMQQLLIFDLDNTLINYGGLTSIAWHKTTKKVLDELHIDYDATFLADIIIKINDEIWNDENKRPKGGFSYNDLRTQICKHAVALCKLDDPMLVSQLVMNYDSCKKESVYVFEDVKETLIQLKEKGYLLALLTNGASIYQREKLKRSDLERYFDGIFIEEEQGIGKPDAKAYQNVCNYFKINLENAWMIGDHYLWEVVAPIQLGMKAIWVSRGDLGLKGNESIHPTATIHQIHELLTIL